MSLVASCTKRLSHNLRVMAEIWLDFIVHVKSAVMIPVCLILTETYMVETTEVVTR